MEIENKIILTSDNEKIKIRKINGYIVKINYTQGKTLYECMEGIVKKMNDHLKYKVL